MLSADHLTVLYGGLKALDAASFTIAKEELVSIVGANGAGKTTLLKAISGTVDSAGEVDFEGADISGVPGFKRTRLGIIHVPQGRHVFPTMTVEENLDVAASYRGSKANFDFVYELFPILKDRRAQVAGTLSGGQQQMLAIGRGLMSDPKLLMLDEPSTGLAPALVDDIFDAVLKMRELRKMAIVLVEQRASVALDISSRCYVLEQGRIVLSGNSRELRSDDRVRRAYLGM
jgi:branched-chain amino acid transport system ATP-binding protein